MSRHCVSAWQVFCWRPSLAPKASPSTNWADHDRYGVGAPEVLVAAHGLPFAPAYEPGALNPGCMPLFVTVLAAVVLRELWRLA
jgi:hypothetical protein